MPQSLSKVYVHIIFSTKNRQKLIDHSIEKFLFEYIGGTCKALDCNPIIVGGYKNHIHILCTLSRKIAIMDMMKEIKMASSKWIKTKGKQYANFYWQDGYGIFSVNYNNYHIVEMYILNQRVHHSRIEFKKEFRSLMKENNIKYDERYVWD